VASGTYRAADVIAPMFSAAVLGGHRFVGPRDEMAAPGRGRHGAAGGHAHARAPTGRRGRARRWHGQGEHFDSALAPTRTTTTRAASNAARRRSHGNACRRQVHHPGPRLAATSTRPPRFARSQYLKNLSSAPKQTPSSRWGCYGPAPPRIASRSDRSVLTGSSQIAKLLEAGRAGRCGAGRKPPRLSVFQHADGPDGWRISIRQW
jgi:hypothetical protein